MTREEYIEELRARISHLPKEERESALSYYIEYLEDATDKTMEETVAELGTPGEVAERIIAECAQSNQERGENAGCPGRGAGGADQPRVAARCCS